MDRSARHSIFALERGNPMDYRLVSDGKLKRSPSRPAGSPTGLSPGRPTQYLDLPVGPSERREIERKVKKLLDDAVKKAAKRGRLPRTPRDWILNNIFQGYARSAFEGLAADALWGITLQDVKGVPGNWYFRLSLNDLGGVPGCYQYNDGTMTMATATSCPGPYSGLYKYMSRDLTSCGAVRYTRTHKVSPCVAGEAVVEPATESRPSPLPPDPFDQPPEPDLKLPNLVRQAVRNAPRLWGVTVPLTPATQTRVWPWFKVGQVVGRAGRGMREVKGRSVAAGLAVAWWLTTWLEVLPELLDVWEEHFGEDNFTGHENVDNVELFFDLFAILVEEVFLDPVLARVLRSPRYMDALGNSQAVGSIPRLDFVLNTYQRSPLPQIGN